MRKWWQHFHFGVNYSFNFHLFCGEVWPGSTQLNSLSHRYSIPCQTDKQWCIILPAGCSHMCKPHSLKVCKDFLTTINNQIKRSLWAVAACVTFWSGDGRDEYMSGWMQRSWDQGREMVTAGTRADIHSRKAIFVWHRCSLRPLAHTSCMRLCRWCIMHVAYV